MTCTIVALPVRCGDCLLVSYPGIDGTPPQYLLIDTGYANTYHRILKPIIQGIVGEGQEISLFVLTHTDSDHIGGTRPLLASFDSAWFKQAWFNYAPAPYTASDDSGEISIKQGIALRDHLLRDDKVNAEPIIDGHRQIVGRAVLSVLSPDEAQFNRFLQEWKKEEPDPVNDVPIAFDAPDHSHTILNLIGNTYEPDPSWSNRSSIAFILQIGGTNSLFTGDAHADILISSLRARGFTPTNPIVLQLMKVSHHGSKGNTSDELMSYIDCQHYLISANASNRHHLPHKEALARIIWATHTRRPDEAIHLYFNYNNAVLRGMFTTQEQQRFSLICHYPDTETEGITVTYSVDE